jgi:glycosyltransferase involved in cell wall biosynthesis
MPAYNVEPYIAEAIESVLRQTFTDLELLVVDDGATDSTADIAARYAERDTRVRVLRKANGGLSSARNHALTRARGHAVALLDSDDVWAPAFLERQMAILGERPDIDIVTGNARELGGHRDGQPSRPYPDHRPPPDLEQLLADEGSVFIMSVFRRRVAEVVGDFDETMRSNEDYDYWIRAALANFRFARNDEPLGSYRRRSDSLSAGEERMLAGILRVLYKHAPAIAAQPRAHELLCRQIDRFEAECLAAQARTAIETGHFAEAAERLDALHARRPDATIAIARLMARWTPALLSRAYSFRRSRQLT